MKLGIILQTKEPEKAWNAFRFAIASRMRGHEVKLFLMGEAVECESVVHEKYDVPDRIRAFLAEGGIVLACGTCLKSRRMDASESCPLSTMNDCVGMVEWADRTLTF